MNTQLTYLAASERYNDMLRAAKRNRFTGSAPTRAVQSAHMFPRLASLRWRGQTVRATQSDLVGKGIR